MSHTDLLYFAIEAAVKAGEEILKIYETDFKVEIKSDSTPVTKADQAASKSIIADLAKTNIPVLSEEDEHFSYENRKQWNSIWIVDPLDGTKEFVKRNGEFTVNIALIENNKPVIGVIYSPTFRYLYYALNKNGSYKINAHDVMSEMNSGNFSVRNLIAKAKQLPLQNYPDAYTIVASRSHLSKQISERVAKAKLHHNSVDIINTGSSIKFCLIAEGLAHEYPRYGPTMEWDTAAGQCIVEEAGGTVLDLGTNEPMTYNRKELRNNDFIVLHKA
ncbi:MAG: 3(2),5-bisphosphate nucleotidase [Bacteroidetes bacterium]|jgi:3'(2'), 5'-bisphosphate nucleotidase|nr:3(2),5-bisphosphate nucleotidase [Bacteroidota bacterium]